ncbi:MAG TPA: hypothetical protein VHY83_15190 [Solirubrobacteraceae bacterium]|jgi:hypothetical protein|nr:hypothetical protein [Solirubrobacteraceae bacterium]
MLTQLLMLGAPVLWLTVSVVVVAACRVASRADATRSGAQPARAVPPAHGSLRGRRPLQLVQR